MPQDNHGYQHVLLIGDIFSKFIQAVVLKDQTANSIVEAFLKHWVYIHGTPYFLLDLMSICNSFGIEKRRSSAYHNLGNGFAGRNIRNIRDMLRAVIFHRKMRQNQWRQFLPS